MNLPLLQFLYRRYAVASVLCALPPVLVGVMIGWVYPRYSARTEALRGMVPFLERVMGQGVIDIFSLEGFFQLPFQHPLTLVCIAVAVALPALFLPAGERGRGGLDLLLATRLTRRQMTLTIALFQLPVALLVASAPWVGTWIGAGISGVRADLDFALFGTVSIATFLLASSLGAIALLISVWAPDRGRATLVYGAIVVAGVLGVVVAAFWEEGAWLERLTPFGYYHVPIILSEGAIRGTDWLPLLVGSLVAIGAATQSAHLRRSA